MQGAERGRSITDVQPRATKSLVSLSAANFYVAVAEGLGLIAEHVDALVSGIEQLSTSGTGRAVEVVAALAEEEAAKYLIMVDAVRCPFDQQKVRAVQLGRFGDHLAKGIYARVTEMRPASWTELLGLIESLRQQYYLDGPNDVDWIFRNELLASREERLYVDYVLAEGEGTWWSPRRFDDSFPWAPSSAVRVLEALAVAGTSTPEGLKALANVWTTLSLPSEATCLDDDVSWAAEIRPRVLQSLDALPESGQLQADQVRVLLDCWHYPLYSAELRQISVDLETLRQRQANWSPEGWEHDPPSSWY